MVYRILLYALLIIIVIISYSICLFLLGWWICCYKWSKKRKKICQDCKKLDKKELNKVVGFWKGELEINLEIIIDPHLSSPRFSDFFRHPLKTLFLFYGGYMQLLENNKYEIVINQNGKSANERGLLHELAHIKLKHEEKKRGNWLLYVLYRMFKFEAEADKLVISYKELLRKRKEED